MDVLCTEYNRLAEERSVDPLILVSTFVFDFTCCTRSGTTTAG
jgi:hypothetical protein